MLGKFVMIFMVLYFSLLQITGCSISANGTLYRSAEPEGEEYETIGVVNGLWEYDVNENRSRIEELLPEGTITNMDQLANLYQVRVGVKRGMFSASASEVVILPDGWTYTTESDIEGDNVINVGDVVSIRAQKNRQVDYFTKIVRKCNETPDEGEKPEWDLGCQSVAEFDEDGFGGETYFWTGF